MWETIGIIVAIVATGFTVIGFIYTFLRNFKTDINGHISRIETRMDILDDRMFQLATGKSLQDAILEERVKREDAKKA